MLYGCGHHAGPMNGSDCGNCDAQALIHCCGLGHFIHVCDGSVT